MPQIVFWTSSYVPKGPQYRSERRWPKLLDYKFIITGYMDHIFDREMFTFFKEDLSKLNTWVLTELPICCLSLLYFIALIYNMGGSWNPLFYGRVSTYYSTWWYSIYPITMRPKFKLPILNWPIFYWNFSGRSASEKQYFYCQLIGHKKANDMPHVPLSPYCWQPKLNGKNLIWQK